MVSRGARFPVGFCFAVLEAEPRASRHLHTSLSHFFLVGFGPHLVVLRDYFQLSAWGVTLEVPGVLGIELVSCLPASKACALAC